jgi:arylsulfatase
MSADQANPNILFIFMDNLGYGEVGCYGGGVLRGAPTPRIDTLAREGTKLLNFNVEPQCTPSRSCVMTGRHSIRSGTHSVPIAGGPYGLLQWEETPKDPVGKRLCHRAFREMASGQRAGTLPHRSGI